MQSDQDKLITIIPIYRAHSWLLPVDLCELKCFLVKIRMKVCQHGHFLDKVELHLVNDTYIAKCNRTFLYCTGPTNILSFPGDKIIPGDLVLSLDTYVRECKIFAQDPLHYLLFLLVHGFAHLAGFDHGSEMDIFQNLILNSLQKNGE